MSDVLAAQSRGPRLPEAFSAPDLTEIVGFRVKGLAFRAFGSSSF